MATQTAQLTAKTRGELGSRANKKLRDKGMLPAVLYGHKEAVVPLTITRKELITHLNHGAHLFDLNLDGKSEKVLVKDVQYNHLGTEVIHVDFSRVSLDEKVKITVPLELKGTPKGEADGGVMQQVLSQLEIECLVTEIPDVIRYNISELGLNEVLHIKQIPLPAGVKAMQDGELIVATVKEILEVATTTAVVEGETAEPEVIGRKAAEEGEEGAEGEAGAKKKEEPKK
jgi:large subunit ribosomal protein L25